jgi:DHA1 family bicyclomycin/chloramphenicol resistance-like MFS transporter
MCTYGYLFTYLASSSFVFIHVMGLSNLEYGLILLCSTSSYIVGTWVCRRWLARWGLRKTIWVAGGMTLSGGISLFICAHFPATGVPGLILPFMLIMLAHGVHQPIGQTGAVGPFPDAAGAASAMGGFLMMLVAFGCGTWLGLSMDGTVFPMANGILFWCVAVAFVAWVLIQKDKTLDGQ